MNQTNGANNQKRQGELINHVEKLVARTRLDTSNFESYKQAMEHGGYQAALIAIEPKLDESEVRLLDEGSAPLWAVEAFNKYEQQKFGQTTAFFG